MKSIFFSFFLCVVLLNHAQSVSLIEQSNITVSQLNAEQLLHYQTLVSTNFYIDFHFVNVNSISQVENDGNLSVNLPFLDCPFLDFQAERVNYQNDMNYEWYGSILDENQECVTSSITMLGLGNRVIGALTFYERSFHLFYLGNGLHVLCEDNLSDSETGSCKARKAPFDDNIPIEIPEECKVRNTKLLILYTNSVDIFVQNGFDIQGEAALAISQVNTAFNKSDINGIGSHVILAGVEKLNFTENSNPNAADPISDDLDVLTSHPNIPNLKSFYSADAVVLLTNGSYGNDEGISFVGPNKNFAFSIVELAHSTDETRVFSHEVGHLFGARDVGDIDATFEQPHFFYTGFFQGHKTLMHIGAKGKIDHYSNPNVDFHNHATGTNNRNNARKIRESTPSVGTFMVEPGELSTFIDIETELQDECEGGEIEVSANAICGNPPYTYSWFYSTSGVNNWQFLSTGQSSLIPIASAMSSPSGYKNTFYKVKVKDITNVEVEEIGVYGSFCEPIPCPTCPQRIANGESKFVILPNPYQYGGKIQIELSLVYNDNITFEIQSIDGCVIEKVENINLNRGNHSLSFSPQNTLSQGTYIVVLKGIYFNQIQKLTVM